jgi:Major Facilitator Superfamily
MSEAALSGSTASAGTDAGELVVRKVFWRLIPFLFVLYALSYLDRINIGFAALSMNQELGLSRTMFGVANTIFYIGYVLCEVPSNLLLVRYGAHRWIPRIMITWGLASAATMLAVGPNSLYALRLLVGIAEAGFLPGVLSLSDVLVSAALAGARHCDLHGGPAGDHCLWFDAVGLHPRHARMAQSVRMALAVSHRGAAVGGARHCRVVLSQPVAGCGELAERRREGPSECGACA